MLQSSTHLIQHLALGYRTLLVRYYPIMYDEFSPDEFALDEETEDEVEGAAEADDEDEEEDEEEEAL